MDKERRNPLNLLNKKNYYNTINLQIENLRDLVELQVERCFNLSKLSSLMSEKQFKNLKRVVITGCGDSYSAAGSMLHAFRLHSNVYDTVVPDPMEFCRFYTEEELLKGRLKNEVLVIAISDYRGRKLAVSFSRQKDDTANGENAYSSDVPNTTQTTEDAKAYAAAEKAAQDKEPFASPAYKGENDETPPSGDYLV